MKRIIVTTLLATLAICGCASLPDSVRGPFARSSQTASDADVNHYEVSPFPAETDEGKF
jgi:starvation-inducible outer membrane lipoprotein